MATSQEHALVINSYFKSVVLKCEFKTVFSVGFFFRFFCQCVLEFC